MPGQSRRFPAPVGRRETCSGLDMRRRGSGVRVGAGVLLPLLMCLGVGLRASDGAAPARTPRRGVPTAVLTSTGVLTPARARGGATAALPLAFERHEDGTAATQARGYGARVTPEGVQVLVPGPGTTPVRTWGWTLVGAKPWRPPLGDAAHRRGPLPGESGRRWRGRGSRPTLIRAGFTSAARAGGLPRHLPRDRRPLPGR